MSFYRSSTSEEIDRNRDPRRRDRSRSEIRRPTSNVTETLQTSSSATQVALQTVSSTPANHVIDFFKTLGLNAQLIQALINANPPTIEEIPTPTLPAVNNAQEFASFLSQNYGLNSVPITSSPNPPINRDPRRRPNSAVSSSAIPLSNSSTTDRPRPTISIEESYKQFLTSIDQTSLNDEIRRRFQRIALLDDELDKLHRMHIELNKNTERHSRRRTSTKEKDPLLKENENLQRQLIECTKTLKTSVMNTYSASINLAKQ